MKGSNVVASHKDYLVQVTFKNGQVYDLVFRRDPTTDTIKQLHIFQQQWDHEAWDTIPKLLYHSKMYLNTETNELEVNDYYIPHHVPRACRLVTYEMFAEVGEF